jgi:hypothetical protein
MNLHHLENLGHFVDFPSPANAAYGNDSAAGRPRLILLEKQVHSLHNKDDAGRGSAW